MATVNAKRGCKKVSVSFCGAHAIASLTPNSAVASFTPSSIGGEAAKAAIWLAATTTQAVKGHGNDGTMAVVMSRMRQNDKNAPGVR